MSLNVIKLLFQPGAGGNWLIHAINNMPINGNGVNFHRHTWSKQSILIEPTHQVPDSLFLFLQGHLHFNFFLNSIYKFWITENHTSNNAIWFFNKMLRNWAVIRNLSVLDHKPDFDWDNFINDPGVSYQQILTLQKKFDQTTMTWSEFMQRRQYLFDTMVNTANVTDNIEHDVWVLAVLAEAKYVQHLDQDWQFSAEHAWQHYRELASDLAVAVKINHHVFDSNVSMPNLNYLTSTWV